MKTFSPKKEINYNLSSSGEPNSGIKFSKNIKKRNEIASSQKNASELSDSQITEGKSRSRVFKELNKTAKEHYDIKKKYEILQRRIEFLKSQEEKFKRDALQDKKKEEMKNKILEEKKREKEYVKNYFREKEDRRKRQNLIIKEKYKEENKMLKSINVQLSKKNKKEYDTLRNQKEKLEKKKMQKANEFLEEKKIRVNAIKKEDRTDKESVYDKMSTKSVKTKANPMNTILSEQEKEQYLREKELIEQYKKFYEELKKQEQHFIEKIEEEKKKTKNRSESVGRIKIAVNKNKNKNLNNRTKSSYKTEVSKGTDSFMIKYHTKLNENKKVLDFRNNNIKKINANDV